MFRSSPVPFSITTLKDGRFLDVNAAFECRCGHSRVDLIGHTVHELKIWEDAADRSLILAQQGIPIRNVVARFRSKLGGLRLTTYSADRTRFDGQDCILAVSKDIPQYERQRIN